MRESDQKLRALQREEQRGALEERIAALPPAAVAAACAEGWEGMRALVEDVRQEGCEPAACRAGASCLPMCPRGA